MAEKKIVQTELEEKEYEIFREAVKRKGLTIKQGLREAVQQWIATHISIDKDPLFKVKPVKTNIRTGSSKIDRILYGGKDENILDTSALIAYYNIPQST